MNLFIRIITIMFLASVAQTFMPWWTAVIIALLVEAVLGKRDQTAFFSGFYGIAIPWMILATYIDIKNGSILSDQILDLFSIPRFAGVMIVITGLVGGLIGGIGSLTGSWIRAAFITSNE